MKKTISEEFETLLSTSTIVKADRDFDILKTSKNNVICETLFRFVASIIMASLLAFSAFAHDSGSNFLLLCGDDTLITPVPGLGSIVEAAEGVNLRSNAPSKNTGNIFNEIIAKTKKEQTFRVIGMVVRPSIPGNQIWINLEDIDEGGSASPDSTKKTYWAFMGYHPNEGEVAKWNFSKPQ